MQHVFERLQKAYRTTVLVSLYAPLCALLRDSFVVCPRASPLPCLAFPAYVSPVASPCELPCTPPPTIVERLELQICRTISPYFCKSILCSFGPEASLSTRSKSPFHSAIFSRNRSGCLRHITRVHLNDGRPSGGTPPPSPCSLFAAAASPPFPLVSPRPLP